MTACVDWRDQLEDHALGRPASAELAVHLAACPVCAAALGQWRQRAEQLDAGVRQLVASEPTAGLPARLLAMVSAQPAHGAWAFAWKPAIAALAVGVALTVSIYVVRGALESREQARVLSSAVVLSQWRSPTESLLQSPAASLLKSGPQLGESFFELKPTLGESEGQKGAKNES